MESRHESLRTLLTELVYQIGMVGNAEHKIEILTNIDAGSLNGGKSTGAKRQQLLEQAKGEYIIFIDDDDWIEPYYISELLKACASGADCFGMVGYITTDGHNKIEWRLSKNYENRTIKENGYTPIYLRKTNHITGVKREIALKVGFPNISNAEDKKYSDAVAPLCKTEYSIVPAMYTYRYQTTNKQYV